MFPGMIDSKLCPEKFVKQKFMDKQVLDYFQGDELAASVWERKYRFDGEKTPDDSFKRYCNEIAEKELTRINQIKSEIIWDDMSDYGQERWQTLIRYSKEEIISYFLKLINFKNIILGGSMLATIGNKEAYSSLSNCFVLGQPYDSYAGINQKTMEACAVMSRRGGCVEENTKVIIRGENNQRIIKKIKDVKIGDYILSFNLKTHQDEWKRVNNHYIVDVPQDKQIVYKYENGTILKTSAYHPVLVIKDNQYNFASYEPKPEIHDMYNGGSKNLGNKSLNKEFIKPVWDESLSNIGWLIGAHMGDGTSDIVRNECNNEAQRIRFSKSDLIVVQKYKKILETITGSNTQIVQNTRKDYKVPVWSYFSTNKNNKIFIDKYFDNQCGNKTLSAHIPNFIKQNNLWIPFIAGLVDTDGFCNNTGKLEITLSNYNVISEIAEWIESIGDYCSTSIKIDNRKDTFNDSYIVRIYTYSKIYGLIKKYLCNPKRLEFEGINKQSLNYELLENELNSVFGFPVAQINYDTALYNRVVSNRRTLKKTFTANLMSLDNYKQACIFDDTKIAEISSRVKQTSILLDNNTKQIYYDISVEDNNNYYAGNFGFVNIHNCGIDLSTLRPDGAVINNQAKSSPGIVLFAERYSNITKEVAIRGRRGAMMLSLSIAHPDAEAFALSKQDLTKITGANISLIIDDEFMHAVETNSPYYQHFPCDVDINNFEFDSVAFNELVTVPYINKDGERLNGYVRKVRAKELWQTIIECAWRTAEPGIMLSGNWKKNGTDWFYDEFRPITTNPCFAANTPVLTDKGYFPISELVGKKVNVWNGHKWSEVEPRITNHNQEMLKITLSDGSIFRCTKYHNWPKYVGFSRNGYEEMTEAKNLKVGDKLSKFSLPLIEGTIEEPTEIMYTRGFYCGDGTTNSVDNEKSRDFNRISLYGEKIECAEFLAGYLNLGSERIQNNISRIDFITEEKNISKNFVPDCKYTIKSRLDWLAGLIDSDGCVCKQEGGGSCQIGSTNFEFLNKVKLMLTTIGISSRINNLRDAGYRMMPDQKGGLVNVFCKAGYRLLINAASMQKLLRLGLVTHRVDFTCYNPLTRDSSRFITIKSIEEDGIDENVYCFNEPYRHKAIFNGFLLGQCSEISMQPYDSCRLASINLLGCVDNPFTKDAQFNYDKLYKLAYEQLSILDNIIDLECDYVQSIIDKTNSDKYEPQELKKNVTDLWYKILEQGRAGRRAGAGFTALGDTLAAIGLKYDSSAETKHFLLKLFRTKMRAELDATTDLAILFGAFKGCDANKEFNGTVGNNEIFNRIAKLYPNLVRKMKRYGRRNVSWSTAAPTGSLSILSQTTSGIEPLFLPWYKRRKKCITDDERVDYIDPADGNKFTEFFVLHPQFAEWLAKQQNVSREFILTDWLSTIQENELNNWFENSPWYNCCANDIDWKSRVEIQAIVQEYTTHSISSTINLPSDVKQEIISEIYLQSWKSGLKGNTVYRDGCRGGVLVSTDNKQKSEDDFDESRAPKRPRRLPAKYHTIRSKGKVYSVIIGFYKQKPYEIFIATDDNLPENFEEFEDVIDGELVKDFKDWYNFECDEFLIPDLGDVEHEDKEISLMLSMALRHRTPLKYIIKTLSKTKPLAGSFTYKLIKILSKYIVNGETDGEKCPECGQHLIYENGCRRCPHCGWTKC